MRSLMANMKLTEWLYCLENQQHKNTCICFMKPKKKRKKKLYRSYHVHETGVLWISICQCSPACLGLKLFLPPRQKKNKQKKKTVKKEVVGTLLSPTRTETTTITTTKYKLTIKTKKNKNNHSLWEWHFKPQSRHKIALQNTGRSE